VEPADGIYFRRGEQGVSLACPKNESVHTLSPNKKKMHPLVHLLFKRHALLEFSILNCTRVRQYVTDVAYACQIHNCSFEAQTETGMSCAAVFTQI